LNYPLLIFFETQGSRSLSDLKRLFYDFVKLHDNITFTFILFVHFSYT